MPRKHIVFLTGQGTRKKDGAYEGTKRPFVAGEASIDFDRVHFVENGKIFIWMKLWGKDAPFELVFECKETKEQLEKLLHEGTTLPESGYSQEYYAKLSELKRTEVDAGFQKSKEENRLQRGKKS